jgi:hypothetical protein
LVPQTFKIPAGSAEWPESTWGIKLGRVVGSIRTEDRYVYIYIYVCKCLYVYVYVYVYMHMHIYAYFPLHLCICIYIVIMHHLSMDIISLIHIEYPFLIYNRIIIIMVIGIVTSKTN